MTAIGVGMILLAVFLGLGVPDDAPESAWKKLGALALAGSLLVTAGVLRWLWLVMP